MKLRTPRAEDGIAVWQFIREAGQLDINSTYCYIMLCDMFRDTCVIAECEGDLCGFLSSYRRPDQPDTLFVWQVAVAPSRRGQGIGKKMLQSLLSREAVHEIQYVEATIGPANEPSIRLFLRLAEGLDTACHITPKYGEEMFPAAMNHEAELLYRVGPLTKKTNNLLNREGFCE
ncbi:diaminobutyrate acetyltransferase [Paenibacillus sp. GCM10027626]|uniref:diaminobutyrate acetyltransferase n=1 Tax=Paenibacillus sp. GCM10027626 TaxID=3273411 RepID=UPI00363642D0